MADLRPALVALSGVLLLAAAGCGDSGNSSVGRQYRVADLKAAYVRAAETPDPDQGYFIDPSLHQHVDFVPEGSIEICPLTQRADVPVGSKPVHTLTPKGSQTAGQFALEPIDPDEHVTPRITQSALVFATDAIADAAMAKVSAAMEKCPATYEIHGGPPQILGTYALNSRRVDIDGWQGQAQQLSHSYQADDVYYEDIGHAVVHRDNVILDVIVAHDHVVGDRADSVELAQDTAKAIVDKLG